MKKLILTLLFLSELFSFEYNLKSGWNLIGSLKDLNLSTSSENIKMFWSYNSETKNWEYFSKNIKNQNYSNLTTLKTGQGFWIYVTKDLKLNKNLQSWYQPNISTTWQWQLTGDLNLSYDVDIYDIDLFDTPKETIAELHNANRKVICYFSAGSYENWRPDKNQFPESAIGNILDGWEDEKWLDIRNSTVREIMKSRLNLAVEKGCDGVEADNVDGFANNSGFDLTFENQLDFNIFLANEAHKRNLSIGLKNDLEQINQLVEYFDFAINEQCNQYSECDLLLPFIQAGKPVFNAEYNLSSQEEICKNAKNMQFQTLILPLNLDGSFRIECN